MLINQNYPITNVFISFIRGNSDNQIQLEVNFPMHASLICNKSRGTFCLFSTHFWGKMPQKEFVKAWIRFNNIPHAIDSRSVKSAVEYQAKTRTSSLTNRAIPDRRSLTISGNYHFQAFVSTLMALLSKEGSARRKLQKRDILLQVVGPPRQRCCLPRFNLTQFCASFRSENIQLPEPNSTGARVFHGVSRPAIGGVVRTRPLFIMVQAWRRSPHTADSVSLMTISISNWMGRWYTHQFAFFQLRLELSAGIAKSVDIVAQFSVRYSVVAFSDV